MKGSEIIVLLIELCFLARTKYHKHSKVSNTFHLSGWRKSGKLDQGILKEKQISLNKKLFPLCMLATLLQHPWTILSPTRKVISTYVAIATKLSIVIYKVFQHAQRQQEYVVSSKWESFEVLEISNKEISAVNFFFSKVHLKALPGVQKAFALANQFHEFVIRESARCTCDVRREFVRFMLTPIRFELSSKFTSFANVFNNKGTSFIY